jgi:5'-methylthioadenosine phosphorylase
MNRGDQPKGSRDVENEYRIAAFHLHEIDLRKRRLEFDRIPPLSPFRFGIPILQRAFRVGMQLPKSPKSADGNDSHWVQIVPNYLDRVKDDLTESAPFRPIPTAFPCPGLRVFFPSMPAPKIAIIGGTGLGQLLGADPGHRHEIETPFGWPSDDIIETQWEGLHVFLLSRHGPGHLLNPTHVPFQANIFALKLLGCTHILATGAVGSLRQEFAPRDLVVVDQLIDKTSRRAGTFFDKAAVHVEFAEPFCPVLRKLLIESSKEIRCNVHDGGCYICMEGPAFSTRAESLMHRLWGADLVGMTACPEARLAREAEIPYALTALVTDFDCWRNKPVAAEGKEAKVDPQALLAEITAHLQAASANAMELIRAALRKIAADPAVLAACPAGEALKMAIWSDKGSIAPEEIRRLGPLWGRYFGA